METNDGPVLSLTAHGIVIIPSVPRDTSSLVPGPAVAAALAAIASKVLELAAAEFFKWLFSTGQANVQSLLQQFCEVICSFVFRVVREERIKAQLITAQEKLNLVNNQLVLAAQAPNPTGFYERLLVDGLLGSALVAYKSLNEEVGEVAYVNYAIVATCELAVMGELIRRGSDKVSMNGFHERIEHHQSYLALSAKNLQDSIPVAIKAGAELFQYPLPATNPGEPGSPETFDFMEFALQKTTYRKVIPVEFWLQKPAPYSPAGFEVISYEKQQWVATGPQGPLNPWIQERLREFRRQEAVVEGQLLTALHEAILEPTRQVLATWPSLAKRHNHPGSD